MPGMVESNLTSLTQTIRADIHLPHLITQNRADGLRDARADHDYLFVFKWDAIRENLKKGNYKTINGVKVNDATKGKAKDIVLKIPVPKNSHGVNVSPDGKYAICSGKVSPTCTVVDISKIADAYAGKIKPEQCVVAQPFIGLGPLHTCFDGRGNAITSVFIDSTNVKRNIQKAIDAEKLFEAEKKKTPILSMS